MNAPIALESSVVAICDANSRIVGTGFVVNDGVIVTCAHVVDAAGSGPNGRVIISFAIDNDSRPAKVIEWSSPQGDDIAILAFTGGLPIDVKAVSLGDSTHTQGHAFRALGYPQLQPDPAAPEPFIGVWADGSIVGSIERATGERALQLSSADIAQGTSGAPILDLASGRVVGMVTDVNLPDRTGKHPFTAWATPAEAIQALWPSLTLHPPVSRPRMTVGWPMGIMLIVGGLVFAAGLVFASLPTLLATPTPRPTNTATLSPTWTPMPTATPLPALTAFLHPGISDLPELRDVAAGGGQIWFATDLGLLEYDYNQLRFIDSLSASGRAVSVDPTGHFVWLGLTDGRIGRYSVRDQTAQIFDVGNQFNQALSILARDATSAWLGDTGNGVFLFVVDKGGERVPGVSSPQRVEMVVQGAEDPLTLWTDGGVFVFGWQADQWKSFGPDNTDGKLPSTVNSIARDAYGHIWFAHDKGLTVLARGNEVVDLRSTDWQTCDFSGTRMLPGVIWSIAISDAGRALWFSGENGLGRIEVTDTLPLANCRNWSLATWPKTPDLADFWNGETRLALDETPTSLSVWIIKRNQKRAYHIDWR